MNGSTVRVSALRWGFRFLFGLPRPVKRLMAGPAIRRDGQVLDLDLQLLGRIAALLASSDGGTLDQSVLAEQRRQADLAAEVAAEPGLDDIETTDLEVPGAEGPLPARLYVPPSALPSCASAGRSTSAPLSCASAGRSTSAPLSCASAGRSTSALLVYFHGGGFVLGSVASIDPLCRLLAAQSGVRVLSVDYRLAPEHPYPAALDDAISAFRWARKQAEELGARPELVAVGGDSAGANLALVVAHEQTPDERPAFVLAMYPVTDAERTGGSRETFGTGFGLTFDYLQQLERLYLPDGVPSDDSRGAILRAADLSDMPPVYISTAGFDPLRDDGEELVDRFRTDGVPVVARRFPGLVHGYAGFTAISAAARDATLDAASALRAALALVESRRPARS